jgi:N utilization substance protein A
LIDKEIDVYRELNAQEDDVSIEEFADEVESWIIDELKKIGLDSAKSVLAVAKDDLERRTDLERESIDDLYSILSREFED